MLLSVVSVLVVVQSSSEIPEGLIDKPVYSDSVSVALITQQATRMRHFIAFSMVFVRLPYSSSSHKWHDFRNKVTKYKICLLIFCTTFV